MNHATKIIFSSLLILVVTQTTQAHQVFDCHASNGAVVSVSEPGAEAGLAMLKKGGNAVDAAVATAFAMAVTYPAAGNIGGGGFMVIYPPSGKAVVIDYREVAPLAATAEMFAKQSTTLAHNVVGVPGTVKGLALAHQTFGKLPWKTVLQPAIELANMGFPLDAHVARSLNSYLKKSKDFPEFVRVFSPTTGKSWKHGDVLKQPDLGRVLEDIANFGTDGFYKGRTADLIVAEMKRGNGIISHKDLELYEAKVRTPIHGKYRGYDIYGAPPPSSGGIGVVEMLNIIEPLELRKYGRWSTKTNHYLIEAMRRAFLDRARHLGDQDFVKIPKHLLSKEYAKNQTSSISPDKATKSVELADDIPITAEGDSTTHFSVIDKDGMAVSNTYTLEHSYGSRIVVKGAGFLLNNEMGDFNWKPGVTNTKGRIGTKPNLIKPRKRMLSSQSPTIVVKNGKPFLITGSPGGRTIINTVFGIVVNVLEFDMDLRKAVDAPRLHQQWLPDETKFEGFYSHPELVQQLQKMGHRMFPVTSQGDGHSIIWDQRAGKYRGVADRRLSGHVAAY